MLGRKKKNWVVNDFIGLINDHYLSLFCFHTPLCHAFSFTNGASIRYIQWGNFWRPLLNSQGNKPNGFGFWNPSIYNIIHWLGCMDDGTNESSTKRLMFQVLFFFMISCLNSLQKYFQSICLFFLKKYKNKSKEFWVP